MSGREGLRVLVAGAGIGGLAAALALANTGQRVAVLERRPVLGELGAGIQLAPNAFAALDRLGVGAAVRARAVFVEALTLMDGVTGARLAELALDDGYRTRFGNPYGVVHRRDLYEELLAGCRASDRIDLLADTAVVGYEQSDAGVVAVTGDGRRVSADVLVGADGIRSAVREQMVGDGPALLSGHTIYRTLIPMELVPADLRGVEVTLWAGPGWHLVHYPVSEGRQLNLAVTKDDGADRAVTGEPVAASHVLAEFPGIAPTPRRLLELGTDWRSWVLADRDPLAGWSDGRVVLLGDAAHPMLQYVAQGACQALEDAVALAGELHGCGPDDVAQRVGTYSELRVDRAGRTQLLARDMGRVVYHAQGEAALHRNATLAAMSQDDLLETVAWLHGALPAPWRHPVTA